MIDASCKRVPCGLGEIWPQRLFLRAVTSPIRERRSHQQVTRPAARMVSAIVSLNAYVLALKVGCVEWHVVLGSNRQIDSRAQLFESQNPAAPAGFA
jgi:hypothetical protein